MNIKIGIRNIIKNYRRSVVTIIAISVGFMSLGIFGGYIERIYRSLEDQAIIGERLAHLTVFKSGAIEHGRTDPGKYYFTAEEINLIKPIIESMPGVELVSPRINLSGLISNGRVSTIFIAEGISYNDMKILRGKYADQPGMLDPGITNGSVIGSELGRILDVSKGDDAVLMVTTLEGQINALDTQIVDIVNTGKTGTNDKFVLLPFEFSQALMDTASAARITVLLKDGGDLSAMTKTIKNALADTGIDLDIKNWIELSSFYKQVKGMFDMIFLFIFIIVLTIVIMSVINTMGMSVMERTREIGTMRSLGMDSMAIMKLFSVEGLLLAFFGCVIGLIFTVSAIVLFGIINVTYVPPGASNAVPLVIEFVGKELLMIFALMVSLGLLAALIPARKASRMNIVDSLGHA